MPTDFDIQVAVAALIVLQRQPRGRRLAMLRQLVELWNLHFGPDLAKQVLAFWKSISGAGEAAVLSVAKSVQPEGEATVRITDQLEEWACAGIQGDPFADLSGFNDDLQAVAVLKPTAPVLVPRGAAVKTDSRVERLNGRRLVPFADAEGKPDVALDLTVQASIKALGRAPEPKATRTAENYAMLPVRFGTDRRNLAAAGASARFGADRSESGVVYGTAMVSIPKSHRQGEVERPASWWNFFGDDTEYAISHIVIHSVDTASMEDWIRGIHDEGPADGLLFIHGYNTSFDEAVWRTAQMAHDLNFAGQAFCFSWASVAKLRGYPDDEATIDWSTANLETFLGTLCTELGLKKLHVIAHSMGNRAFLSVLERWQHEHQRTPISQIILAAPDIDADRFRQISRVFDKFDQVTLYSSRRDRAISLSRGLHGKPRAGDANPPLVLEHLITVDVTQAGSGIFELAHSYFAEVKAVFEDLICVINDGKRPPERLRLRLVEPNGHYELV